jgi:serine/threonine protein kinase
MEDQALTPPEALLGAPLGTSADMWTLGCIVRPTHPTFLERHHQKQNEHNGSYPRIQIFELLTGEALFDPAFQTLELGLAHEESHLIQMIEVFGALPVDLIRAGAHSSRWFTEDGASRLFRPPGWIGGGAG